MTVYEFVRHFRAIEGAIHGRRMAVTSSTQLKGTPFIIVPHRSFHIRQHYHDDARIDKMLIGHTGGNLLVRAYDLRFEDGSIARTYARTPHTLTLQAALMEHGLVVHDAYGKLEPTSIAHPSNVYLGRRLA